MTFDLVPGHPAEALDQGPRSAAAADGRKQVKSLLGRHVAERLAGYLLAQCGAADSVTAGQLPCDVRLRLVERLKQWRVGVHSTKGMARKQW